MAKYVYTPQGEFEFADDAGVADFKAKTQGMPISENMWVFDTPEGMKQFKDYALRGGPKPLPEKSEMPKALGRGVVKGVMTLPDLGAAILPNLGAAGFMGGPAMMPAPVETPKFPSPSQSILDAVGSTPPEGTWPRVVEALTSGAVGGVMVPGGPAAARAVTGGLTGVALEAAPDDTTSKVSAAMIAALLGHSASSAGRALAPGWMARSPRTERSVREHTEGIPEADWNRAQGVMDEARARGIPLAGPQAFENPNPLHDLQRGVDTSPGVINRASAFFREQRDTAGDQLRARVASLDVQRTGQAPSIVRNPEALFDRTPQQIEVLQRARGAQFPAIARQAFQAQVERAFGQTGRGMESPTAFGDFTSRVYGTEMEVAKRENFRAIMRGVVRSYPGNKQNVNEVVAGAERFMELMQAVSRNRPGMGMDVQRGQTLIDQLQVAGGALGFGSRAIGAAARLLGRARGGRTDRELADLFFSPGGFEELRAISRSSPHRVARGSIAGGTSPILQEVLDKEQSGAF